MLNSRPSIATEPQSAPSSIEATDSFGGEIILRVLESQDIRHIFSSPGSEWVAVWEALAKEKAEGKQVISYINCRHEELAVGAALGYWKAKQRMEAVLLHTSVGTLHGSMALRTAYQDRVPMFVAAGRSSTFGEGSANYPFQWERFLADASGPEMVASPWVKWTGTALSVQALPGLIEHACRIALTPPQGPVLLCVPLEVTLEKSEAPHGLKGCFSGVTFHSNPEDVDKVARLLVDSNNPIIITEEAGRRPENVLLLVELAEALSIPVIESTAPTYLNFPRDHPLHLGFDASSIPFQPDLILAVGTLMPWHPRSRVPGGANTIIVVIDEDPAKQVRSFWNYNADIWLTGSVGGTLKELINRVKALKPSRDSVKSRTAPVQQPPPTKSFHHPINHARRRGGLL